MRNFLLKYRFFFVVFIIFFSLSCVLSSVVLARVSKSNGVVIVLDAGHGGRDGGSVGKNGTIEKDINLDYTLALKERLIENGYVVVLTRKDDDGLYSEFASNKKISDMTARMNIIKKANPNLVVSIHMNSFADSSVRGANCYYKIDDEASKTCADLIQSCLQTYCNAKNAKAKGGDYFMLNCSYYTSVLVECGFLSNPEEENDLKTTEYRDKIVDAIYNGILLYFGNKNLSVQ